VNLEKLSYKDILDLCWELKIPFNMKTTQRDLLVALNKESFLDVKRVQHKIKERRKNNGRFKNERYR
jgi:hypothetical protein